MQEITTGMREKAIKNMEWIGREKSKRKIKSQAGKNVKFLYCVCKTNKINLLGQVLFEKRKIIICRSMSIKSD